MMRTKVTVQADKEYRAGYQSGLKGEPKPSNEKGRAFLGGWMAGSEDREFSVVQPTNEGGSKWILDKYFDN